MALPPGKSPAPATAPTIGDAFLREVDEEVRRDQLAGFWKRWGGLLVAVVALLLAGLGGFLWWQDQQVKKAGAAGDTLAKALARMEVGDNPAARPLLEELVKGAPGGYPALARFMLAADRLAAGEDDKAAEIYEALAGDAGVDPLLREAALLRMVRLRFDAMKPEEVVAKLKPLSVPGNPWFGVAGEMTAMAHLKADQPEPAKPILTAIARDEAQPPSLRNRAAQLAIALGVEEAALGGRTADGAADGAADAGPTDAAADGDAQ